MNVEAPSAGAMAAARARERALAGYRKDLDDDEDDEENDTLLTDETSPMMDEDGNRVPYPKLLRTVRGDAFNFFIIFWVCVAGVLVGVQTDKGMRDNGGIIAIETFILTIFLIEAVLKLLSELPKPQRYFRDPWNILDFAIVVIGVIGWFLEHAAGVDLSGAGNMVMVFRLFRLLRIMKLVKAIPQLRIIITTMLNSIVSVGYISILILLLLYVYAVLGCFAFGDNDPKHFGNLGIALITLFRVMTFDQWSNVMYVQLYGCAEEYSVKDVEQFGCSNSSKMPAGAVFYFFTFLLILSFNVLNLFIGVITTGLQAATREVKADPTTGSEDFEEVTNQDIEKLVMSLKDELMDCRSELNETKQKLAVILQNEQ